MSEIGVGMEAPKMLSLSACHIRIKKCTRIRFANQSSAVNGEPTKTTNIANGPNIVP